MMNKVIIIISLLALSYLLPICGQTNQVVPRTYISGKFLTVPDTGSKYVSFIGSETINYPTSTFLAPIDEEGNFELTVDILHPQELYLSYGRELWSVICLPNDSLYLEIGANNKISFVSGTASSINNQYVAYKESLSTIEKPYTFMNLHDAVKTKNAEEFKTYVKERSKVYLSHLNEFKLSNEMDNFLNDFLFNEIEYWEYDELLRYRWVNPSYNASEESLTLSLEYYDFLKDVDSKINGSAVLSKGYINFVEEYIQYWTQNFIKANKVETVFDIVEAVKNWDKNFFRDYFITYLCVGILEGKYLNEFEQIYTEDMVGDVFLKEKITYEYQKLKEFMENTEVQPNSHLDELHSSKILAEIATKFKGSVIYIDFWAPWCGPCLEGFPHSKELQEELKDENVKFVFLGVQCSEESWKATIANKEMSGEHFLLNDDRYLELKSLLGISGIPHYTLLDKNGNILLEKAPTPANKEELKKWIKKALK